VAENVPALRPLHSSKFYPSSHVAQSDVLQEREVIKAYIVGRNSGGLILVVAGTKGFLPWSNVAHHLEETRLCSEEVRPLVSLHLWTGCWQEFRLKYKRAEVLVTVMEANQGKRRLVVSNTKAESFLAFSDIAIGTLVKGRIKNVSCLGLRSKSLT